MKILSLVILFMMGVFSVFAHNKPEKFKVNGVCKMCEKRIEKAALSVSGVSDADWNKKSKILFVTYSHGVQVNSIHSAVAKTGHDTELLKAKDEAYNRLPECCKYDRSSFQAIKE